MDNFLHSWGLGEDVVQAFAAADVTLQSLQYLTTTAIERIIPKEGPRCMFMHHFSEFKAKNTPSTSGSTTPLTSSSTPPASPRRGATSALFERPSKRSKLDRSHFDAILNEPSKNELHDHLKQSIPGLIVLGFFKCMNYLDDYTRDLLSQECIYKELKLDFCKSLSREDFSDIADTVVDVFPTETKITWYDVVTKSKRSVVEGRLRNKWYSVRRALAASALIPKSTRMTADTHDSSGEDTDVEDNPCLQLLFGEASNWKDVEEAWESSEVARSKVMKNCKFIIHDYVSKFPCLEKNLGWKLLADDGERKHDILKQYQELWTEAIPFLVSQIRTINSRFALPSGSDDVKFMNIILQLPKLWRVRHLPKSETAGKSSKIWRPSISEVTDSLCLHVLDVGSIRERINERKKTLQQFKYTLQPVAVVVGPFDQISQCFILLDDYRWEVDSPLDAVFGVMKICFGLGAGFPIESRHIWLYLQRVIFNISTPEDYVKDRGLRAFLAARLNDFDTFCKNK